MVQVFLRNSALYNKVLVTLISVENSVETVCRRVRQLMRFDHAYRQPDWDNDYRVYRGVVL